MKEEKLQPILQKLKKENTMKNYMPINWTTQTKLQPNKTESRKIDDLNRLITRSEIEYVI